MRKNMTDTEKLLWSRIRRKQLKGYQFYRQKTVGNYIVDFYCPSARLIIELDGSQHYEEEGIRKDKVRDQYLTGLGFQVMRFPSIEVFDYIDGIVDEIYEQLHEKSPQPPLEKGEKENGMSTLAVRVESRAVEVIFAEDSFRVILADGREIAIPIEWFPRLLNATPEQKKNWRFIGSGIGIHWEEVDEDISIKSLLATQ
jgi:very-short-patch-repair endonuclease